MGVSIFFHVSRDKILPDSWSMFAACSRVFSLPPLCYRKDPGDKFACVLLRSTGYNNIITIKLKNQRTCSVNLAVGRKALNFTFPYQDSAR